MSSTTGTHQRYAKISIVRLACILATFMAIAFLLCVIAGFLVPAMRDLMPITYVPGFSWEDPLTAAFGAVWSIGFGAYVAVLFGLIYNAFGGAFRTESAG